MEQLLAFLQAREPAVVTLVVIDSLDSTLYYTLAADLEVLHKLASAGLVFDCETVTDTTTPAIASILTGLLPEEHGIFTSNEVGTSPVNSLLELLDDAGLPTGAILETEGTRPLVGRISYVCPVDDREDIAEYDGLITTHTVSVVQKEEVRFVFAHLRAIDRFAHRNKDLHIAAQLTNKHMKNIAAAVSARAGVLLICGDHVAHLAENRRPKKTMGTVPLIASYP
ncbi:MAG: sulfatase-like hydrolase/transferase [Methanomicrobia archaeon]|nr:sulfatase-like hydrolase/transferase [Methanomicrobia archaeon]